VGIKQEIEQLEEQLTHLLGKEAYACTKRACAGKHRGPCDYGLAFQDGGNKWISLGRKRYAVNLQENVEQCQCFRSRHAWLEDQIRLVLGRDNRQASALGLPPAGLVRLELIEDGADDRAFWTQAVLRHEGKRISKMGTLLHYACLGFRTGGHFAEKRNRPDEALAGIRERGQRSYAAIIFGCLYEREKLNARWIV
jgi:hypothetical protein